MPNFLITVGTVAVMLAYAVPGFLFIKTKLIPEKHIPSFARLLLYVCQPCLTTYSIQQAIKALNAEGSTLTHGGLTLNLLIFLAISAVLQCGMLYF